MLQTLMDGAITKASPTSVPNLLTYGRIVAVPAFAAVFLLLEGDQRRWIALTIFVAACFTDWLDGYLARMWQQQSMLGRMLDPIADKLLVGAALILLVQDGTISRVSVWAALIILSREILVSGLREFLAELNVKVHVSRLAKWKTTLQMVALGVLLAGPAGERQIAGVMAVGTALLWVAALLTIWTGGGYLTAAVRSTLDR
ncbi:MAG: CDP-diacylglycerol--glycerol-3-phosphate 3-phosphatidyltransferase [Hyphomicrobiaceae bacterium]